MFTGLIEEVGKITRINPIAGGKRIFISCKTITDDLTVDDSVAVNGVCLTATKVESAGFWVDAVAETLQKSSIGQKKEGSPVNLERAMRLQDRLGGHLVQGHVSTTAPITRIEQLGENWALDVKVPDALQPFLIGEGSIALDGISLTIARLHGSDVGINIIPHTWKNTNLASLRIGDLMNVEVDLIAKYVSKMLSAYGGQGSPLSMEKIKQMGFE